MEFLQLSYGNKLIQIVPGALLMQLYGIRGELLPQRPPAMLPSVNAVDRAQFVQKLIKQSYHRCYELLL